MNDFWRDRPVLVTGATGLVGSWLVRRLHAAGAATVCLIRDWTPHSELVRSGLVDKVAVVRGDVREQPLVERVLAEYEVAAVVHLAAQTIVSAANRSPAPTLAANIEGTWTVLEACRAYGRVGAVVIASSDKAYGPQTTLPYTEQTPLQGRYPYDVSKSCADLIGQCYAASYGLPVAITRCGNIFGGGDLNWSRIVPGTIRSVLRGERPVIRSDGRFVRDYLYVEDAAAAYALLAERLTGDETLRGEAFNFSYEQPRSVLELVERMLSAMGSDLEPDIRNEASNEIRDQYLSAAKARQVLGWQPEHALDEALGRTIEWYRGFLG